MATNINRFLSSIKNSPEVNKLIKLIDKKYPSYALGAQTPLLNHYLPVAKNLYGNATTLFLKEQASVALDNIRHIAQKKSVYRLDKHKTDTPIDFLCFGYQDHGGDVVIERIVVPALIVLKHTSKSSEEAIKKSFDYVPSKDFKIDTLATYYDYLLYTNLNYKGSVGKKPVALLGTTKPIVDYDDRTENCPRLSEIAKSIVPGDVKFDHDFLTGLLTVSPYEVVQTPEGLAYKNGSLECVLTDYKINKNTHFATPEHFTNITKCVQTSLNGKLKELNISNSDQPKIDLQTLDFTDMIK